MIAKRKDVIKASNLILYYTEKLLIFNLTLEQVGCAFLVMDESNDVGSMANNRENIVEGNHTSRG